MNSINSFIFKIKRKSYNNHVKPLFCLFLTFSLFLNFVYFFNNFSYDRPLTQTQEEKQNALDSLNSATDPSLFQDPFTINFNEIWDFFNTNYLSDLGLDVDTYFRIGNNIGTITDDKIYPVDNLYLYNTLLRSDINATETYKIYMNLRNSLLWYNSTATQDSYGFVGSVDNSTKDVFDDKRYLIDNLMAICLLIENIGNDIDKISIGGIYPQDSIEEIFALIDSSQFYDLSNKGFSHYNTSDFSEDKFTESNLYAILTNLKIRHIYEESGLNPTVKNRAYELANFTMDVLLNNMWDDSDIGFDYMAYSNWTNVGLTGGAFKYLSVNALGIITLLEYWLETGMNNNSLLNKAISLYNKINQTLWTINGFEHYGGPAWEDQAATIELDSNALMMKACLRLFELTGNYTYYNQAMFIFKVLETDFYDGAVDAYDTSNTNQDKNLNANLKLVDSYLKAFEIYNSSDLKSTFNITGNVPSFIFDQDTLNVSSVYSIQKNISYYNTTTISYETFSLNYTINSADINYLFKYPNGTLFDTKEQQIIDNSTTLTHYINNSLSIGDNYKLFIFANTTYFGIAQTLKLFNVISGLENQTIEGLPSTLYQGPIYNITLPINNTRDNNVTLTVTLDGEEIIKEEQIIEFNSLVLTNVSFNLTARLDAIVGPSSINFTFKDGNILYLEIIKQIEIGYSFDYTNFFYQSKAVAGNKLPVTMNIINFLPNSTQALNVSFTGENIQNIKDEIILDENEIRTLFYQLNTSETIIDDYIEVEMTISKGITIYYIKTFNIEILPKFEIISSTFPNLISQGEVAYFIMIIRNNQDISEPFSIYVNELEKEANIDSLSPGDNRIELKIIPTINPYDFESKSYTFILKNSLGEIITQKHFEIDITLSTFNLILFYIIPIIIPIGIILVYKNKEIKHRLLRR